MNRRLSKTRWWKANLFSSSGLVTRFPLRSGLFNRVTREVHAVENISFDLWPGETLSLVGESGSGKSTTGRALLRLVESRQGRLSLTASALTRCLRVNSSRCAAIFSVFSGTAASLDPRQTVGYSIMEPLRIHGLGQGTLRQSAWHGCLSVSDYVLNMPGVIRTSFPAVNVSASA